MQYNFNAPVDRRENFSAKHDELVKNFGRPDLIPLWVADMDLPTAQPIVDAIEARNRQAIFGYTSRPDSYFRSFQSWQYRRNGWRPDTALMSFNLGVVPALSTIVKELTGEGDKVLFITPVYSEFFNVVEDWGRVPLTCTMQEKDGYYSVDFTAFEEALRQKPAFFILCNPHNPVGRVWTLEELTRMGELCLRHNVRVISDEIHSDLMLWGNRHIPFASISREFAANTITCISATKTFNLAGLQASTTIFPNEEDKERCEALWRKFDVHRNNCFSAVAMEAAFTHGEEWLEQLLRHIEKNMLFVKAFLEEHIPAIKVALPQSTYLLWLDCRGLGLTDGDLVDFMVNKARLALGRGTSFGDGGSGYMRLNVACPLPVLQQAMEQLKEAVEAR